MTKPSKISRTSESEIEYTAILHVEATVLVPAPRPDRPDNQDTVTEMWWTLEGERQPHAPSQAAGNQTNVQAGAVLNQLRDLVKILPDVSKAVVTIETKDPWLQDNLNHILFGTVRRLGNNELNQNVVTTYTRIGAIADTFKSFLVELLPDAVVPRFQRSGVALEAPKAWAKAVAPVVDRRFTSGEAASGAKPKAPARPRAPRVATARPVGPTPIDDGKDLFEEEERKAA